MKIKVRVSEATNLQLDWMVAQCEGWDGVICSNPTWAVALYIATNETGLYSYSPSTNWAQGGPIIERERIQVRPLTGSRGEFWESYAGLYGGRGDGNTALIAAMRCFIVSRLGEEVNVPEELS